jgi:hypothetical protein
VHEVGGKQIDMAVIVEIAVVSPPGKATSSRTANGHVDPTATLPGRSVTMYRGDVKAIRHQSPGKQLEN